MTNKLKVGFLKEKKLTQATGIITILIVDDQTKWKYSEMIDSQLQNKLDRNGVFGFDTINIMVDDELSQTRGVGIINENTLSKMDQTIREYLKELCMDENFNEPLKNERLNLLHKISLLTRLIFAVEKDNLSSNNRSIEDKWVKVITAEL
jgi:hypothetical protein